MEALDYNTNMGTTLQMERVKETEQTIKVFVVEKHADAKSSRSYFELLLEVDGMLKHWLVPKGPSMNPREKRLAKLMDDKPSEYLNGRELYAKGKAKIWDSGSWEPTEKFADVVVAVNEGLIEFSLHGEKLKGNFILVKLEYSVHGNDWLLIKREDDEAVNKPYDAAAM